MRQRWLRTLALSLGVLMTGQGAVLRADPPAPIIEPYPPVETTRPKPAAAESADSAPAASLERPIPLDDERPIDHKIQPAGLFSSGNDNSFAIGPAGSIPVARPMPSGPSTNSVPLPMPSPVPTSPSPPDVPYSWRQPPTSSPASQDAFSTPLMPMPNATPGSRFGTAMQLPPGTSFGSASTPLPQGTVVSPGIVTTPGTVMPPGSIATPGVVTGPMGGPIIDGGGMGNDCCNPGSCAPDCCTPGCCAPGCCDGMCCDGCCGWGNGCCFGNRWYASAEYLLWFIRGQSLPPLLSTGPLVSPVPGALGQPGTAVLFGNNSNFNNNPYSGVRLRAGYWFGDCHGLGLDIGGFFLGGDNRNFRASSVGIPFLGRPFFNALTGVQDVEDVAAPGLAGTFTAVSTFFLYGAEANLRRNLCCGCNWFIDGFIGWRMLGLNESLSMNENLAVVSSNNPALPAGSTFNVNDRFATNNLFNGGQIGAIGEYRLGRWSFDLRTSVGVGGTMQWANVSGSTTSAGPGILPTTLPGGLLALSSNIGTHTRSMVSFVEEVGLNVGYQFTNHIRGFVGYNFLFWSNVIRPGQQIDLNVNPNLIPPVVAGGPNRPAFTFDGSNFWVQGIQFGLDIRW